MQLSGERQIDAPRAKVWAALNDPDVLRSSIPGCETLEKQADDRFTATVAMKVGPVKARMDGDVQLSDIDAPNSYVIAGKGKGAAGMASGEAKVSLAGAEGGTLLTYVVDAKVGGKLAEVGSRFIDSTAAKMADQFFDNFAAQVTEGGGSATSASTAAPNAGAAEGGASTNNNVLVFAVIAALGLAAATYFLVM